MTGPGEPTGPATPGELRALLAAVTRAGGCTHPVRLAGTTLDQATGELWEGAAAVACKDRRAAVYPACAARYRADAWHLVAAGLCGGKGVPGSVAGHPAVFVTLTAPSFGPVHTRRDRGPCRPRRAGPCPHGVPLACPRRHGAEDPVLGEPLCPGCFDYEGAVLWNTHVGRLWDRTATLCRRGLARAGGLSPRQGPDHLRLSYVKVAEFQRRGLVHLHVVVRVDGPGGPATPPPPWASAALLTGTVEAAVATASAARTDGAACTWGRQLEVATVTAASPEAPAPEAGGTAAGVDVPPRPPTVAAYLAKYVTKSSEASGALAVRLRSIEDPAVAALWDHPARLVRTAWALADDPRHAALGLRAHAHSFGFRGHVATKSHRYSTTFTALRAARRTHRAGGHEVDGTFTFAGRGHLDPAAARLAQALAAARPEGSARPAPGAGGFPGRLPGPFPATSPRRRPGETP